MHLTGDKVIAWNDPSAPTGITTEKVYLGESHWSWWRLWLLDFDQGLVGPLGIVERGFELCRW